MRPPLSLLFCIAISTQAFAALPEKVTYEDHVLPILQNACNNCHNPDKKKAGLDLTTYGSALLGSDGGKVILPGDAGASLLLKCVNGKEEPAMPPKGDRLSANDIAMIERWIATRALESANSKAAPVANAVAAATVSLTRPSGPPPMPANLPTNALVNTQRTNALIALAASPWAPLAAVGGQKQISLYHTDTLELLGTLPFDEGLPTILRFSKNGELLMAGGGVGAKSGKVALWKISTGERLATVGNEVDQVLAADLSPDQTTVALGGPNRILKFYSTKDGKLIRSIKKHTDWVTAVAYSPDGNYVASADRAGGITVWEGATGAEAVTLPGHKTAVNALAFLPGLLVSASQDGSVILWDIAEGKERKKWVAHAGGCEFVDFTPEGRIVTCGRDKVAKVWDQTGKVLLTTQPLTDIALRAVLCGDTLVAGDWNGKVKAFLLADGGKSFGDVGSNP
ncbi:MAG: c-type cytochrome domain-containing protein [Verrucomicrobiota bacterium]